MILANSRMVGFISSRNLDVSKIFYRDKLSLPLVTEDKYALEFSIAQSRLRVTKVQCVTPAAYAVLGWEVDNIRATIETLVAQDIQFERYEEMPQNTLGICEFPGGGQVAWFKDPDGNTLSITEYSR